MPTRSSWGSVWFNWLRSVMFCDSMFLRVVIRSVRCDSAFATAPSRSIGSGAGDGRSTGLIVERHISSSVPLTIRRFSASSLLRSVACATTSCWRRVASSAWACTMSIGAIVPISTRARLSATSFAARSSDCCAASTAW